MQPAICILGPLEVRDAGGTPVSLGGQKPRELLAALVLHRGQVLTVDRLVDRLWGGTATAGAATTLRTYVGQVRRILEAAGAPAALRSRSGGYCLEVEPDAVDAVRFDRLVRDGQQRAAAEGPTAADTALGEALDLWRGEVLADLGPPDFARSAAAELDELRLVAWEGWLDAQLALGRHRAVVGRLQALVDEHPFRERFAAQLMLALYRSGRQADALAVSAATRLRLSEELGVDPGPELRDLETSMLRQSPGLAGPGPTAAAPADHAVRSLAQGQVELLEREEHRARLVAAIASAARGEGAGVAVAGDAGAGKSTLVQVACADGPRLRLLRGWCDPLHTPRPLGPLRDLARRAGFSAVGGSEEMLLPEVCEDVLAALAREPTVLVVEDIHWVDAATADVLRFLARRIRTLPLALLVTYREHEVGPRHPARRLLGDMANQDGLSSVVLDPLTEDGVRRLVAGTTLDAGEVHALTGGNPFYVTEIAKEPDRPLPRTVRDAVLARTAEVTAEDLELLQLVATAPDRLDDRVLAALRLDVSALVRLEGTGLLTHTGRGLGYRHELARQAVESTIPVGAAAGLHLRVVEALERAGVREPAVLTHHAVAAGDRERAYRYAREAGEEACRKGAHGEGVAFFKVALDHVGDDAAERAAVLERLSFEQYLTDRLAEAIDTVRATIPLWRQAGDDVGLATAHERTGMYEYYNARRHEAESQVEEAAAIARSAGSADIQSLARATRGFLAYMSNDLDLALECTGEAVDIAAAADADMLRYRAELIGLLARLASGEERDRAALDRLVADARARGWDELASTGYSQISSIDIEHRRLDRAAATLAVSLPFAEERDIPTCGHWQTSIRARVHHARGDWGAALADAQRVLDQDGMAVAKLWPHLLCALIPLRRHGKADEPALAAAWDLMRSIDEPLRRLSVHSALAEVMWTTGMPDRRVTRDAAAALAAATGLPGAQWAVGDLAAWLRRLGLAAGSGDPPPPGAEPYALAAAGRVDEAAAWWSGNGEPFAEALVLADSDRPEHRARAVRLLEGLGARATAARVRDGAAAARP